MEIRDKTEIPCQGLRGVSGFGSVIRDCAGDLPLSCHERPIAKLLTMNYTSTSTNVSHESH